MIGNMVWWQPAAASRLIGHILITSAGWPRGERVAGIRDAGVEALAILGAYFDKNETSDVPRHRPGRDHVRLAATVRAGPRPRGGEVVRALAGAVSAPLSDDRCIWRNSDAQGISAKEHGILMVSPSDARLGDKTKAIDEARRGFEKVLSGLIRHQRYMKPGMLCRLPPRAIFSNLRRPDGGFQIIGDQGAKGLRQAADAFFRYQPDMRGRVCKSEVVEILRLVLAREVFERRRRDDDDDSLAHMLLALMMRYVRRYGLRTNTYALPCILPHAKGGARFQIGPVAFLPAEIFFEEYRQTIDASVKRTERLWIDRRRHQTQYRSERCQDEPSGTTHKAAERWVQDFRDIFLSYPWIATVEIESCAPRMGQSLARRATGTALDALRLVFGRDRAYNIRLGGAFRLEAKTAHATLSTEGHLDITFSQMWESSGLPDDWLECLSRPNIEPLIARIGSLIRRISMGGLLPPLYQRVVDSLAWYGEAVSGPEPHTCVLRCMTALERLLVTPGKGRAEDKVRRRGNLLCSISEPELEEHWKNKFEMLYELRHDLVHGDLSPFDDRVLVGAVTAERVTRWCLWAGVYWAAYLAQQKPHMEAGELNGRYEQDLELFCRRSDECVSG